MEALRRGNEKRQLPDSLAARPLPGLDRQKGNDKNSTFHHTDPAAFFTDVDNYVKTTRILEWFSSFFSLFSSFKDALVCAECPCL